MKWNIDIVLNVWVFSDNIKPSLSKDNLMQNTITCVGYKNEYTQKNGVLISYSSTSYEIMFK